MDFSAIGREPISEQRRAGEDIRYDPLFEKLQAEVDRASSPASTGTVDWQLVANLAADILSHKSKDLLVAGYLGVALVHTRGVGGFSVASSIFCELLEQHGPDLFPQRERARLRAVEWWLAKSEAALTHAPNLFLGAEECASVDDHLIRFEGCLRQILPEAPSLKPLRNIIRRLPEVSLSESPETSSSQTAPPPPETDASAGTDSIKMDDEPGPLHTLEEIVLQMREMANALLGQDISNPLPYRLCRQAAWVGLTELPPATGTRTMLPSPAASLRNRLADLRKSPDPITLFKELEAQVGQFIFWLDLNRFAAEALAQAGATGAVAAVGEETSLLLRRLPGLDLLCFSDGTPFADPQTKGWLREVGRSSLERSGGHLTKEAMVAPPFIPAAPLNDGELSDAAIEAAGSAIGLRDLATDVERLQNKINESNSARERLQWRMALSQSLLATDRCKLALPHLEQIMEDIATFGLEVYEPRLAMQALKLAWRGFGSQSDDGMKTKATEALHKIARIDAAEIFRMTDG